MALKLYKFQQEIYDKTKDKKHVAYYLDMGLGKTFVGSEKLIHNATRVNLIICQKSKVNDWINHMQQYDNVVIYDLTNKKQYDSFFKNFNDHIVGIINYDIVKNRQELLYLTDYSLLLDESSLIQHYKSKRTKTILKYKPSNVILLSGTPISGHYENLWTQLKMIGYWIGKKSFEDRYCNFVMVDYGYGYPVRTLYKPNPYKNIDELKKVMENLNCVFMKTEEAIELPEKNFIELRCKTPKEHREMLENGICTIQGKELVGDYSLTKRLRLREIASCYNSDKARVFEDLINSTEDRLIVFYNFNAELSELIKICNKNNRPYSQVNGAIKDLKAYEESENSITLVQYQSGSMGLNLQLANKVVFYSPTDKCELYQQSIKRINRIGQNKTCFYYQLLSINSIEINIMRAINRGIDYTDELFRKEYEENEVLQTNNKCRSNSLWEEYLLSFMRTDKQLREQMQCA